MKKKEDQCPKYLENSPLLKGCVYAVSVMHTMHICIYINIVPLLENRGKVHHLYSFVELHPSLQKNVSTANSSTFWFTSFSKKLFRVNVRGWAEAELKLCARIKILVFVWRLPKIPAFWLQLSRREPEEYLVIFTFTLKFLNKYAGTIYSSWQL